MYNIQEQSVDIGGILHCFMLAGPSPGCGYYVMMLIATVGHRIHYTLRYSIILFYCYSGSIQADKRLILSREKEE